MAKAKKLPSGSWRVQVFVGTDSSGKQIRKSFTAPSKKEAEYMAAEFVAGIKRASPDNRTLSEAYARYIEIKRNTLSPATVREYERAARRDFPELMRLRLSQLTQEKVQCAVNEMSATHSPKSVKNAHGLLSAVLRMFAPDIRLTTRMPQNRKADIYIPTESDIEMLMEAVQGKEIEKAILLAAFGSLRRSECCALTAADINGDTVNVNKALVKAPDGGWTIKPPKSKAGYRIITLPSFVIERLVPAPNGRIVNIAPSTITDYFRYLIARLGLPHFRFHDLRHFQASILHAIGVPDKYIMERGGWKTDSTLKNIYQHTLSDRRREVERSIVDYFEAAHEAHKKSPSEE